MTQQQGSQGQSQGQGQPTPDPAMGQNPNNEANKPGYDPSRPTLTEDDPGYQQGQDDQGAQRPGR